jgi:uncharacterized protein (DUF58 family)
VRALPTVERTPEKPGPGPVPPAVLRSLDLAVLRRVESLVPGEHLTPQVGAGTDLAMIRPYFPGDDVRHIDWNVTARQARPYVRRYVEERSLTLWLIVDVSASLQFGPAGRSKADRAAQASMLLATAAIQNGDRVGLALVSDRLEVELAPAGGPRHLDRLVRTLVATPAVSRGTALTVGLTRLRRATHRALIVLLSDFLSDEPVGTWRRVARRHQVLALRLVEPREESLPEAGLLDLEDSERGTRRVLDAGSARVRAAYAEAADRRRVAFQRWCAGAGLTGYDLSTAEDPIDPLIRIFSGRATRRGSP